MMKKATAVLDFGTSKVLVLLAEESAYQKVTITSAGMAQYDGFMNGEWNAPSDVSDAIASAVEAAEKKVGTHIKEVYVGVPGEFVRVYVIESSVALQGADPKVTSADVEKLQRQATEMLDRPTGVIIHRSPAWFKVDGGQKTLEPVDQKGSTLEGMIGFVLADQFFINDVTERLKELGVEVHLNTAATALITKDGAVVGAYAEGDEGVVQYNCKAVVFATGGFGGNPDLIEQQGWDVENLFVVGSSNAAGDAYRMALEVGAKDFMTDSAQSILYNIPALPPIDFHKDALNPVNGYFGIAAGGPVLWVNENCDRYTRENLTDDNLVLQCIPGKDNLANYVVFDQGIFDTFFGTTDDGRAMFEDAVADDKTETLFRADSVKGLADAAGLDADALAKTVERYNELAKKGIDEDFGKPAEKMVAIENGPFYLAKLGYSFFFEVGGVTTDKDRRVLDESLQPIPGLYAIGNDGNMLYRHVYTINMPGTAFGNQVNSGREAANNVAAFLKA